MSRKNSREAKKIRREIKAARLGLPKPIWGNSAGVRKNKQIDTKKL